MIKKYRDIISGSFLLIVSAVLFIASFSIKKLTVSRVGAAFVPQLVALFIALLSISVIINGVKQLRAAGAVETGEAEDPIRKSAVVMTLVLIGLYIALLETLGFIIMTSVYLFGQFYVLAPPSERKLPKFALIAVAVAAIVYYFFVNVFQLMLPPGILG